jgi:hypothetical protein
LAFAVKTGDLFKLASAEILAEIAALPLEGASSIACIGENTLFE